MVSEECIMSKFYYMYKDRVVAEFELAYSISDKRLSDMNMPNSVDWDYVSAFYAAQVVSRVNMVFE